MTPDDKALAQQLRELEREAGSLADRIERGHTPWPGELLDKVRHLGARVRTMEKEVERKRPRVTRGRSW